MLARLLLVALFASPAAAEPFSFVALGDTTYSIPDDDPLYAGLIDSINAAQPAFSIHIGDTKGYGDCGRAFQESQLGFFSRFARPVFYTPGNNEWADCWKENRGSADPTEILALMRSSVVPERPQPPSTIGANADGRADENESAGWPSPIAVARSLRKRGAPMARMIVPPGG